MKILSSGKNRDARVQIFVKSPYSLIKTTGCAHQFFRGLPFLNHCAKSGMIDSGGIEAILTFLLDDGDKNVLDFVNSHKQRHWRSYSRLIWNLEDCRR